MKFITSFSILLLCFFFATDCSFGASFQKADELYGVSGLEKQMRDVGPALLASYRNNYSKTERHSSRDKKIYENIEPITKRSFDTQTMKESMLKGLSKDIDDNAMEQTLAWLGSPVGKKITQFEEKASSREGVKESQEYIKNIKNVSLTPERIRLVKELNSSMNLTDTTVEIALVTQFALSMTTKNGKKGASRDEIQRSYEKFTKIRSKLEPILKHQVHGSLLYTYQTLSDDELAEYLDFANSDSGRKYTSVTSLYMLQAITDSCLNFAMEISQL